jgi:DNA gyrase subunit A
LFDIFKGLTTMTMTNGTAELAAHTNGVNGATAPVNPGTVRPADIVGEMQVAYLDYAMSVIVARALPDVRDGLKPVHRRILYAMYGDLGLTHDKPHKKSARIVGEVLGKYHPHGDVAVYDAMARMAQDFSLRYPLVDGQGNFGSIDGDSPAAMRYTEARLAEISDLIVADLDKDTVEWRPNFDNTLEEPTVLPATLPNLLINGANGIAVGMATNIPPHNLGEVVDALAYMIDRFDKVDDITVEDLMHFIQGPDFPTGGLLFRYRTDNKSNEEVDAITQGYSVGKSRLIMQAKAHFEEMSRGRSRIIITELPYQTNKSALIERIADLVRDGKIEGISDLRDESDRTGMRVVIELSRNVEPKDVLADLYKYTPLQQTFGMQLLALVDGQPRMLSLKRLLQLFIQHRQEIVRRRTEFDLKRAKERAHIVEGLLKALDILDEVIQTIRNSQRVETARTNLMKNFGFSAIQAQAILDMQLRRLAALERTKLKDEFKELKERIAYLEDLLAHPQKILALIKSELLAIKEKYGDARRTQIVERTKGVLTTTDLVPDLPVWVSVGSKGEIRRQEVSKLTNTALRGLSRGADVGVLATTTRDTLYLFNADGRSTRLSVHEIPQEGGRHMAEFTKFGREDTLVAALTLPKRDSEAANSGYLTLVSEQGVVKRILLTDFLAAGSGAPTVMGISGKDRLGWVFPTTGDQALLLVTASGQAIRFSEEEVRSMGLSAAGVGGIKLKGNDKVIYAGVVEPQGQLITLTASGYAKRSALKDYPTQGRNGGGVVTHKVSDRTGLLSTALVVGTLATNETLVGVTRKGTPKFVTLADIPAMGRAVAGKPVLEVSANDAVVILYRVAGAEQSPTQPPTRTVAKADEEPVTPPTPAKAPASTKRAVAEVSNGDKPERKPATPAKTAPLPIKVAPPVASPKSATKKAAVAKAPAKQRAVAPAAGDPQATAAKSLPVNGKSQAPQPKPAATAEKKQPRRTSARSPVVTAEKQATKGATQEAEPVVEAPVAQPTLFAVDVAAPRTSKSKKVEAVVSVPAAQANKRKGGK